MAAHSPCLVAVPCHVAVHSASQGGQGGPQVRRDFTASIGGVAHIGGLTAAHFAHARGNRREPGRRPGRPTAHGSRAVAAFLRRRGVAVW